jgi:6-pyruvoyltetrahydropterin/6-carboxytetrahydropterin synthase
MIQIKRTHEICMGHRVYGHESKCANLHGHNYVFEFIVRPKESLDSIGRVVDFGEVKKLLCEWLEKNWDHKTILWEEDPLCKDFDYVNSCYDAGIIYIAVPFNPTAENIANYFLSFVAPEITKDKLWYLYGIILHETAKCSAVVYLTESTEKIMREIKPFVTMPKDMYCTQQCGNERNCMCEGKTDAEKENCRYCVNDLPF